MADGKKTARRFSLRGKLSWCVMIGLILLMLLFWLLAWKSSWFADWYAEECFPMLSRIGSRICGMVPFSVGEVLIIIGLVLLFVMPISFLLCMIFGKGKRRRIGGIYGRLLGAIFTYIFVTETCNCFVLYQGTSFGETYFQVRTYTGEELLTLYADLVEQANVLALQVQRDADGYFQLSEPAQLHDQAKRAMVQLGETYPRFAGYYPSPKVIQASYWMSQMNLTGIYFPFTLEANYNGDMMDINKPDTICHELSHLRGYLREDEAGFLAYLACIGSDSVDFQYSATISALEYVRNAVVESELFDIAAQRSIQLCPEASQDMYTFLPEGYWQEKEEAIPTLVATDTVRSTAETAMDTTLKLNGVTDGRRSYSRMVDLLLAYWDSQLLLDDAAS